MVEGDVEQDEYDIGGQQDPSPEKLIKILIG